ncbi:thiamine-phosphate kinase [Geobacter hydrogenophilus]|uniref:Thiamine-monophosphate kinase n=1 Tax=Geobacter hydrogenophilus TaxID=40983 RepID=A0A9W6FZI6_9BACT|nr:thiamine-phosphate kinase [Geobacter hydrogenophilus]MBT0893598.1 thiamine-phosphate kinase [Geobacter hydrogenophilus]GLI37705.1 thiamine-monophosphate kinase [Geobacter hydrogenophilus]
MRLREIGEFGLIGRISSRVGDGAGVRIGIGDDAAATEPVPGRWLLVTSDMLLEGIHFDLAFTDPYRLGRKSLAVNLSDVAAMGGEPRHFLLSLAVPAGVTVEFLDRFIEGMLDLAREYGVTLIGGDTCRSSNGLVISVTLHGEQVPELVVRRGGARPGDHVFVTGTVGDSALGLELLRRGERRGWVVDRHLDPAPRVRAGLALAGARLPSAMIDVSDGLAADLGHILDLSGVGARLTLDRLPLSPSFRELAPQMTPNPSLLALTGGEDYELLFTVSADRSEEVASLLAETGCPATLIGEITDGRGLAVVGPDGREIPVTCGGYNHFAVG